MYAQLNFTVAESQNPHNCFTTLHTVGDGHLGWLERDDDLNQLPLKHHTLENVTETSNHMSLSASSLSSALEDAGASFICFSVNPPQLPTLPHRLHFASPGSELFISDYCQNSAHTHGWLLCQLFCLPS